MTNTIAPASAPGFPFPILDLRDLDRGPESAAAFSDALRAATHDTGFFYLVGTGVTSDLEERLMREVKTFFALPDEEKMSIENVKSSQLYYVPQKLTPSPHFRGYTRLGGERTQGAVDWREMLDIWPEGAALSSDELATAPPYARLIGPNLWPEAQPSLRPVIEEWQAALVPAAHKLLRAWAVSLGAPPDFFDRHFSEPTSRLKIVRYPPREGDEEVVGVGAHKDGGCVSLVWVGGCEGLQVQPEEDGPWIDAPPLGVPGAFVCNIGEMVEFATGGYLKATVHRVLAQRRERISVPMFFNPSLDAVFPTLQLPEHLAKHARGVTQDPGNKIHARYGDNLLKSRLRAHPDVAAIHHADLVQSGAY